MSDTGAGQLQNYSVDQAAGAVVLVLGAVASLLLVIWQSRCHCKMNLCYIFQCERRPPSEEEMMGLKDQIKDKKDKKEILDKEKEILVKEDEILQEVQVVPKKPDRVSRERERPMEPEPEPQMLIPELN